MLVIHRKCLPDASCERQLTEFFESGDRWISAHRSMIDHREQGTTERSRGWKDAMTQCGCPFWQPPSDLSEDGVIVLDDRVERGVGC